MLQNKGQIGSLFRTGAACSHCAADQVGIGGSRRRACRGQPFMYSEVSFMKVVLIENPKVLSVILRKIYGIKKVKQDIWYKDIRHNKQYKIKHDVHSDKIYAHLFYVLYFWKEFDII